LKKENSLGLNKSDIQHVLFKSKNNPDITVQKSLGRQEPDFGQNKSHLFWSEIFLCYWNIVEPELYL